MKKVGETVQYVDDNGKSHEAEVTKVFTPEAEHSIINLSYKDENGKTVNETSVVYKQSAPKPVSNYWH